MSSEADQSRARGRFGPVWWLAALVVAGVANHAGSLSWGFLWDDFYHQVVMRGLAPDLDLCRWNLYDFNLRAAGGETIARAVAPWWSDDNLRLSMLRPVASASLWLDFLLHGAAPFGYHVTSLALFALLIALVGVLHRRLVQLPGSSYAWRQEPVVAAAAATALFAIDDVHGLPTGWVANRNTLLATLFMVAGALCWLARGRANRPAAWTAGTVLCLLLACGSKESGLALVPILIWIEFVRLRAASRGWVGAGQRLVRTPAVWIVGLAGVAYLAGYVIAGYGPNSTMYRTPWDDPLAAVARLAGVVPLGMQSLIFGVPTDIVANSDVARPIAVAATCVLLVLFAAPLGRAAWTTPAGRVGAGWMLLALLPEMGGDISDRLWMNASVGSALLLGALVGQCVAAGRRWSWMQAARAALVAIVVLMQTAGSVYVNQVRAAAFHGLGAGDREQVAELDLNDRAGDVRRVYVVSARTSLQFFQAGLMLRALRGDPTIWAPPLHAARRPLRLERLGERALRMTSLGTPFVTNRFERLFQTGAREMRRGDVYDGAEFVARVDEVDGGGVRTVTFEFERPLDAPSHRFVALLDGRLQCIEMPRVGESLELPEPPAPFEGAP